ncbi:MAG: chemotaxis protein CheA [Acidobacteriota bacterium]
MKRKKDQAKATAGNDSSASGRRSDSSARLNDLAARLLQLDCADTTELEALREELLQLARDGEVRDEVRTLAAEALLKLDELLYGKQSGGGDSILTEVSAILGSAIETEAIAEEVHDSDAGSSAVPEPKEPLAPPPVEVDFQPELPPDADLDLLRDFVAESIEQIEAAEASLLALEVDPDDMESVNTVFRAFHTIKGTSGFLGLAPIKELAHGAESLLSRVREGEVRYSGGYADLSLRSVDVIKELIHSVEGALSGELMAKPDDYDDLFAVLSNPEAAGITDESDTSDGAPRLGDLMVSQGKIQREEVEAVASGQIRQPIGEALVRSGKAKASDVARSLRTQRKISQPAESVGDASVRVRTDRLDRLIDMVGELVIAHSMVAQDETVGDGRHQTLSRKASQVGKIVRELQDLSMSLRMVPLKPAFQKVNRLVRDLAQKASKRVSLTTHGEDTEIDRNMVDVIRDPLVHMVRNAVDHGIESVEDRVAAGKSEEGHITLLAYHSGGSVVVELRDDGRGLNRDRIIDKAIRLGLIDSATGMSESEIHNLIFRPGFSTAEQVTEVSGRGVGMDVVRRNIEALRGRVDITSEPGRGCCFKMVLPLTMAITDGMLVQVGGERYIIPTVSILKSFRPQPEHLSTIAGRGEMVMLRGELLPLYRLHRLLGIGDAEEDPCQGLLVIISIGESKYGLLVDELLGQQQVVAKSLPKGIGKVKGVSGAAILGDGRVGLILDSSELGAMARRDILDGVADLAMFETISAASPASIN